MEMTRGDFLKSTVAGAGVALAGLAAIGSDAEASSSRIGNLDHLSPAERNRRLAELLSKDAFSKQLNTSFKLSSQSMTTTLDLKLTEVQEGRSNEQ